MLDYLDMVLFDVKLAEPGLHLKYTGKRNDIILQNLAKLARERPDDVIARIPLIPGITTNHGNLQGLSGILREMGIRQCWLLPYNPLGLSKWATLGKPAASVPERMLTSEEIKELAGFFPEVELVEM